MNSEFRVKLEKFEGPLDLLLSLIEKRKLFINDISLAGVTDDFIEHIKQFDEFPIAESADFIEIASTLVLIKSRSLLPNFLLTSDEEADAKELENKLKILQDIRSKSIFIKERFMKEIIYLSNFRGKLKPIFSPSPEINLENIAVLVRQIIDGFPKMPIIQQAVVKRIISIEQMMNSLADRIQTNLSMSFKQFSGDFNLNISDLREAKSNVIVSFLAVLELVKRGGIMVRQGANFADIQIESGSSSVPKYL